MDFQIAFDFTKLTVIAFIFLLLPTLMFFGMYYMIRILSRNIEKRVRFPTKAIYILFTIPFINTILNTLISNEILLVSEPFINFLYIAMSLILFVATVYSLHRLLKDIDRMKLES